MRRALRRIKTAPGRIRPYGLSLCIHGAVAAFLLLTPSPRQASSRPIYDQEIKPFEHKIIWYNLQVKTPEISPAEARKTPRKPRALRKLDQNLIAGKKDDPTPQPKVWTPDPPKAEPPKVKVEPLPNLLAVSTAPPPPPLRKFEMPPELQPKPKPVQAMPEAPVAVLKVATAMPKDLPFDAKTHNPLRNFVPPPAAKPEVKTQPAELPPPPEAPTAAPQVNTASLAIVGLDPAKSLEIPKPPPPRDANFSAGPKPNPNGESSPSSSALLSVPGLYAHGGPKTLSPALTNLAPLSQQNLMAAMHASNAGAATGVAGPHAPRVSSSPDPRMDGRAVYMMAIQMQNITSSSGSWMVWFAERETVPGAPPQQMRAPDPIRKVDPKYIADAMNERVEGVVRLSAVIRKDGHVDSVEVLKKLDDRLDKSSSEALAKWQFEPAMRDGTPVDVDAVFEIPFRLAPRTTK